MSPNKYHKIGLAIMGLIQAIPMMFLLAPLQILLMHQNVDLIYLGWSSMVLMPYSFKFIWSPLIDQLKSFGFSYKVMMLTLSCCIGAHFVSLAIFAQHYVVLTITLCFVMSLLSSTLDDVIDAIEDPVEREHQAQHVIN